MLLKRLGQGALNHKSLVSHWMNEGKSRGMEDLAGLAVSRPARGIDWISNDGMADVLAMDTNLVRATCLQLHFQPGSLVQAFDDL